MTRYLIDTSVFIDHLRGKSEATKLISNTQGIVISFAVFGELLQGIKDKKDLKKLEKLMDLYELDWGQEKVTKLAVDILKQYGLKQGIGLIDAMLAATALTRKLVLVTDNLKHFRPIDGLTVKRPAELV